MIYIIYIIIIKFKKKKLKDEYTTLFLLFINLKQWLVILANNIYTY